MVPLAHPSHQPKRHLDRFSRFHMGPKCRAVQCIVSVEEKSQNCPSPWDFVTPPDEHRDTAIGNMLKNLVKIGRMFREICSRTDRQTHTHTQTYSLQYFATALASGVTSSGWTETDIFTTFQLSELYSLNRLTFYKLKIGVESSPIL